MYFTEGEGMTPKDIERMLKIMMSRGHLEVCGHKNGEPIYQLTREGREYWEANRNDLSKKIREKMNEGARDENN